MTRQRFGGKKETESDTLSPRTTRVLRDMYSGPIDPAYWESLERRIMARVATEARPIRLIDSTADASDFAEVGDARKAGEEWSESGSSAWGQAFRAWSRAGAIAAGLTILCAGAALWRTRESTTGPLAYETVLATPNPVTEALPYGVPY